MDLAQMTEAYIEMEFANADTAVFRDLSLNFKKLLGEGQLDPAERCMMLLAVATTLANRPMAELARAGLRELGTPDENIRECAEVAGLMGMNNVYYKYRSFVSEEAKEFYTRAGLRMNSMMKPVTGKAAFEMLSLAVSVVNGCPSCVNFTMPLWLAAFLPAKTASNSLTLRRSWRVTITCPISISNCRRSRTLLCRAANISSVRLKFR